MMPRRNSARTGPRIPQSNAKNLIMIKFDKAHHFLFPVFFLPVFPELLRTAFSRSSFPWILYRLLAVFLRHSLFRSEERVMEKNQGRRSGCSPSPALLLLLRGKNTVNDGVQNPNLKKGWGKRPPPLSPPVEKEQTHRERPPTPQTLSVRRRRKTEMLSFPPGGGDADSQEAAPPILMTRFSSAMR